jgi:N-sulfoglucosamine sulfohydrolase
VRQSRRTFLTHSTAAIGVASPLCCGSNPARPNILFCISDDQSWLHTSASGDPVVKTPAFDRVASEGALFTHAFCNAPTCGPSRSAIVTGQPIWRLKEAGNIHSTLPAGFATYPALLESAGYQIGYTSKGWGPGKLEPGGRTRNPAGDKHESFRDFLNETPREKPFCFWLGSSDPHRPYKPGSGRESGMDPEKLVLPPMLPDHPIVRDDILDYYWEVQRFDQTVGQALTSLKETGQADNTIVVVTSDHGMPFPRAKATLYDYGSRVPLAIRWPASLPSGKTIDSFASLADLAPTFLEAAGLTPPPEMTAQSLLPEFGRSGAAREEVYIAMERHDGCRKGGKGYPCRAIRTRDHLYIRNFEPSRWPSGSPNASDCAREIPYGEIAPGPTKTYMMENRDALTVSHCFELGFGMRPGEELYDLKRDPGQLNNVASQPVAADATRQLRGRLMQHLIATADPRALGQPALWDFYPYYGRTTNPNWAVDKRTSF